jgi:hypothetical protein
MKGSFIIQRDIVASLPPKERFLYYELTRLAVFAKDGIMHKEYKITIPRGCWIISYRKLAQLVDMPLRTVQNAVKNLVEKGIIKTKDLGRIKGEDGNQKRTMFIVSDYTKMQTIGTPKNATDDTPPLRDKANDIKGFEAQFPKSDTPSDTPNDIPVDTPRGLQKNNGTNDPKAPKQEVDTPEDTPDDTENDTKRTNAFNNNSKNNNRDKNQSIESDEFYGEYLYVKGALDWMVNDDQSIFNLYKKHVLKTGRNTIDIMELWGEYCSDLEARGIKDFDGYIGKFLGMDGYNMKTKKERLADLPITIREQILAKTTKAAI